MANHRPPTPPPPEGIGDDFLEQIFSMSSYSGREAALHIGATSGEVSASTVAGGGGFALPVFLPGLSSEEGKSGGALLAEDTAEANVTEGDPAQLSSLFPTAFGQIQSAFIHPNSPQHGQTMQGAVPAMPHPAAARPKVRARRGQATDPHSIAERLRRERITERFRALQELLPNISKTDRAAMLDEILDYVKFLRLQVKILSMSRLGAAGAMAHLMADVPLLSLEGTLSDGGNPQHFWEKWFDDGTEHQVARLMEEDIGAAMQFLQSKALCLMPISLATAIYNSQNKHQDIKVELDQDAAS